MKEESLTVTSKGNRLQLTCIALPSNNQRSVIKVRRVFGIKVVKGGIKVGRHIDFVVWYCLLAYSQESKSCANQKCVYARVCWLCSMLQVLARGCASACHTSCYAEFFYCKQFKQSSLRSTKNCRLEKQDNCFHSMQLKSLALRNRLRFYQPHAVSQPNTRCLVMPTRPCLGTPEPGSLTIRVPILSRTFPQRPAHFVEPPMEHLFFAFLQFPLFLD